MEFQPKVRIYGVVSRDDTRSYGFTLWRTEAAKEFPEVGIHVAAADRDESTWELRLISGDIEFLSRLTLREFSSGRERET